ncbi:hypothetical protein ACFL0L_00250 [Patescibacteria group bacterium]
MNHLLFFAFLIATSFAFAKIEVEVEGKHGWAEKMPTWKLSEKHWLSRLVFGGKPATGYHVWIAVFVLVFTHTAYIFEPFNLSTELTIIAFYILFWILEDFLWFVLNPHFGIKNFKKDKIWWHKKNWWGIAPREYFIFLPLGIFLYLLSVLIV